MKLSYVVPVYNVEKYLEACVSSLLAQTVTPHEIILVDDGSLDSSGAMCDRYAQQHSFIKVIHKENAGLGMARNTGLEHVTGDFVVFIDSDDFYDSDFSDRMVRIHASTGCDTCKTSFRRVDLAGNPLFDECIEPGEYRGDEVRTQLLPRIIGSAPEKKDSIPPSACCTMYSMEIIRQHDLRFESERQWISEDTLFNIQYYALARHVVLSEYIGYNYRCNPRSLTTTYRPDRFDKCLAVYHKQAEMLRELGLYDICQHRLIRQFFVYLRVCLSQLYKGSSNLSAKEIRNIIRQMCGNNTVQEMIRVYPVDKIAAKQRLFIYFIRFRLTWVLYLIYGIKIIPGMG